MAAANRLSNVHVARSCLSNVSAPLRFCLRRLTAQGRLKGGTSYTALTLTLILTLTLTLILTLTNPHPNPNPNPNQVGAASTCSRSRRRYATRGSNPRRADRFPGRSCSCSAAHTFRPRLAQLDAVSEIEIRSPSASSCLHFSELEAFGAKQADANPDPSPDLDPGPDPNPNSNPNPNPNPSPNP